MVGVGVEVPASGGAAIAILVLLLIGGVCAALASAGSSSTYSAANVEACYQEFMAKWGASTEAEVETSMRNGSYDVWLQDLTSRHGEAVVLRTAEIVQQNYPS